MLSALLLSSLTAVLPSALCLQIDLEPEGRVYVVIDLSESTSEGRNADVQSVFDYY